MIHIGYPEAYNYRIIHYEIYIYIYIVVSKSVGTEQKLEGEGGS